MSDVRTNDIAAAARKPPPRDSRATAGVPARGGDAFASRRRGRARMERSLQIDEVFGLIYDAALEPAAWPQALDKLADAIGAHIAALGSYDTRTNTVVDLAPRQDPDYIRSYQQHWAIRNPFRRMWQRNAPLGIITPELFMPRSEYTRTEFFQEWVVPQGIEAAMATNTLLDDGVSSVLRLWRPWRIGDFERHEIELFAVFIPHIRRVLQLQHRLAALEMQRTSSVEAFDRLRESVVLVDSTFDVMFANHVAEELFAEGDGLCRDSDGVAAATPGDTAVLRRVIAGGTNGNGLPGAGGRCTLARREGRAPLSVLAVPIRGETSWIVQRRPAAVLFVADPDRDGRMRAEALRQRFDLTRSETRFLGEIVKGDGIQAAADRLGVSLATARTHLRHVFEKTGTQRQAELVGLATLSQPMLHEQP
jgi:DNA-binding CsgD family transcriptional regulator